MSEHSERSLEGVWGLVEAISTMFMHAYMRARTRAIVHPSPMVRLLGQRDQAFNDSVLLEREMAIFRLHRQRCPAKERVHYSPEERAEILQVMRLRGWAAKRTAERFVLHPNTIRNWQKAIRNKHKSERVVGAPHGTSCTRRCDGPCTRSVGCAQNASLGHGPSSAGRLFAGSLRKIWRSRIVVQVTRAAQSRTLRPII